MTKQEFIADWESKLPPYIARQEVSWFLGGIIAVQTLAHADCAGRGPKGAVRVSDRVIYPTRDLLSWLVDRGYADITAGSELLDKLKKVSRKRDVSPRLLAADLPRRGVREGQDANI